VKTIALKLSKEIKTAVLVISGILLFIFIFNYLKGENVFDSSKKISAIYENVEGLAPSAAVTINGHTIGKVQSIEFKGDGSGLLRVTMLISDDFPFSVNSEAQLYEAGLIVFLTHKNKFFIFLLSLIFILNLEAQESCKIIHIY